MKKQYVLYFLLLFTSLSFAQSSWHLTSNFGYSSKMELAKSRFGSSDFDTHEHGWISNLGIGHEFKLGRKSHLGLEGILQYSRTNLYISIGSELTAIYQGQDQPQDTLPRISFPINNRDFSARNNIGFSMPVYYKYCLRKFNISAGLQVQLPLFSFTTSYENVWDQETDKYKREDIERHFENTFLDWLELGGYFQVAYRVKEKWTIQGSLYHSFLETEGSNFQTLQATLGVAYYWTREKK